MTLVGGIRSLPDSILQLDFAGPEKDRLQSFPEGWSQMRIAVRGVLKLLFCVALFTSFDANTTPAQVPSPTQAVGKNLSQMSIEELMNLEVTSGAKKEEPVQRTAAAIFVITQEDIRRSGATTLPDLLRMVPGLDVAQIDGNTWAVSSRGFNSSSANKLLVLVDGRTVYSPVFSGVIWDSQDQFLADIDRIEVIRGPGSVLWGSNAVNGVINIITKSAENTQGGLLTAAGGNVEGGYGSAQYGGKIGGLGFYRVFAKGFDKAPVPSNPGEATQDGWLLEHAGFRTDWTLSKRDSLTVEGDIFHSLSNGYSGFTTSLNPLISGPLAGDRRSAGGDTLGRWHRTLSPSSEFSLQVSFDRTNLDIESAGGDADTLDVNFQHEFAIGKRQTIVWGAEYKHIVIRIGNTSSITFTPSRFTENLWNGFLQDQIELIPSRLRLTVGLGIEQDYSTGFEIQPDVRLLWTPSTHRTFWLATSKALRGLTPSDTSIQVYPGAVPAGGGLLLVPQVSGNPALNPEIEYSQQTGYRTELRNNLSLDIALYYNCYTRLVGQDAGVPVLQTASLPFYLLLPETLNNKIHGETHGLELSSTWKVFPRWSLTGSYSWLDGAFHDNSAGAPAGTTATILQSPRHQFSIRSNINLPHRLELDAALYKNSIVDPLVAPQYTRLDLRLGWHFGEKVEFSMVGQNLLSPSHLEFGGASTFVLAVPILRSYYGKVTWHF